MLSPEAFHFDVLILAFRPANKRDQTLGHEEPSPPLEGRNAVVGHLVRSSSMWKSLPCLERVMSHVTLERRGNAAEDNAKRTRTGASLRDAAVPPLLHVAPLPFPRQLDGRQRRARLAEGLRLLRRRVWHTGENVRDKSAVFGGRIQQTHITI